MKNFFFFLFKIIALIFLGGILMDILYTKAFLQSYNRSKIDYVYNSKPRNYDVVILGSSRANNHFVSKMFQDKGLKTFNFGMSGGHLFEASLMLKLMIEKKYKIENVILEADLNLSNDHRADGISAKFLPYIHNSKIIKEHFLNQSDFKELYYLPFYRYVKFETKIGFREMFFNGINKKTSHLDNLGYYPLGRKVNANMKNNLTNLKPLHDNKYYNEIKQICKINKINFIAIMTPMCENTEDINYFNLVTKCYPEIYNYENKVKENKYFSSCGHLNDIGARKFTSIILKDFFNK